MSVKLALNSKEEYNLDQEVSPHHSAHPVVSSLAGVLKPFHRWNLKTISGFPWDPIQTLVKVRVSVIWLRFLTIIFMLYENFKSCWVVCRFSPQQKISLACTLVAPGLCLCLCACVRVCTHVMWQLLLLLLCEEGTTAHKHLLYYCVTMINTERLKEATNPTTSLYIII